VSAPRQLSATEARAAANEAAVLATDRIVRANRNLNHDDRIHLLQEAELATKVACDMRTYASLVEADDYIEPRGPRP